MGEIFIHKGLMLTVKLVRSAMKLFGSFVLHTHMLVQCLQAFAINNADCNHL